MKKDNLNSDCSNTLKVQDNSKSEKFTLCMSRTWDEYLYETAAEKHEFDSIYACLAGLSSIMAARNSSFYYYGAYIRTEKGGIAWKQIITPEFASPLENKIQYAFARTSYPEATVTSFTFSPSDYNEAKETLFSSGLESMEWRNHIYLCSLERNGDDDIYYDLHLAHSMTTIMDGEEVELVAAADDMVLIHVLNEDHEPYAYMSRIFFEGNFSQNPVLEHTVATRRDVFER